MKKIETRLEVLDGLVTLKDKVVLNVGCGAGELVRELTSQGAKAIGIDSPEMLAKGDVNPPVGTEQYLPGSAVKLPVEDKYADAVTFFASLHHVPMDGLKDALTETYRVLKPGGMAVFLEPVLKPGSYFELTGLIDDEREIQKRAYEAIKNAAAFGLEQIEEKMFYFERSLDDYAALLNLFVDDKTERKKFLAQAKEKTGRFARDAGIDIKDYRFKSICRVNVLRKKEPTNYTN
ncbi:MAG: class I SAM-dependent methyltransferase [Candidatus Aminicenantes bacterium]|nr:class I SAM-dependent methyltransferase [Candidatus Aminicenantes bacterium]